MEVDSGSDLTDIDQLDQEVTPSQVTPAKRKAATRKKEYRPTGSLQPPHLSNFSAYSLYDWINNDLIELEPEYQRDVVWPDSKQIKLIDSLLRNFYVPPLIFRVLGPDEGETYEKRICIDGKQRLTSLRRFMDGEIPHQDSETKTRYWYKVNASETKGKQKKNLLPEPIKQQLNMKQLVCVDYRGLNEYHERDIFQRVQMGMPLQPAERMSSIAGPWPNFANEMKREFMNGDGGLLEHITFDVTRGKDYLAISQVIVGVFSLPERCSFTTGVVEKFLTRVDPPTPAFKKQVKRLFTKYVSLISEKAHKAVFAQRMAPVEFVMIALVIANHVDESLSDLANRVQHMRTSLRKEHVDIRTNNKVLKTSFDILEEMSNKKGKGKSSATGSKRKAQARTEEEEDDDNTDFRGPPIYKSSQAPHTRSRAPASSSSATVVKSSPSTPPQALQSASSLGPVPSVNSTPSLSELQDGVDKLRLLREQQDQIRVQLQNWGMPAPWGMPGPSNGGMGFNSQMSVQPPGQATALDTWFAQSQQAQNIMPPGTAPASQPPGTGYNPPPRPQG